MLVLCAGLLVAGLTLAGHEDASTPGVPARADFYVAIDGNDANPGTQRQPFATLEKARDAVRLKIQAGLDADVLVLVRGGTHRLIQPVVLDPNDSGTAEHSITYAAFPGEKPILSGGRAITGWQPHRDGIWKASTSHPFRQLYVNGARAVRARSPNGPNAFYRLKTWNAVDKMIHVPALQVAAWKDLRQVEMIVCMRWSESILRLDSYATVGDVAKLTVQEPERGMVFSRPYPPKEDGQAYHWENAYECLDAAGEWYLDAKTHILYYMPRAGEDLTKADVVAPMLESLLRVEGALDRPVRNLVFRGLTFEHTTWTRASEAGMLDMQAGMYNVKVAPNNLQWCARPPAAVYVATADRPKFNRNVFQHLGAAGLDFHYGTHRGEIVGNVFDDISGNAIQLARFSEGDRESHVAYQPNDPRDICSCDSIRNNWITRVGQDYYGCAAVACGYPQGIAIEHNEIANIPHSGISVGWGWLHIPNVMKENRIRYNRIHHFMGRLDNGGAIYTISSQPNSEIAYNHISDYVKPRWLQADNMLRMIYLDEGSDHFVVQHNVVEVLEGDAARTRVVHVNMSNNPRPHNVIRDNDTQDETVKQHAGLEPAYFDIKPLCP